MSAGWLLLACNPGPAPPGSLTAPSAPSSSLGPSVELAPVDGAWVDELRVADYATAAALFDARHVEPREPSLRFVRARIAFELEQHARVLELTQDLERELPLFGAEIRHMRLLSRANAAPDLGTADELAASELVAERLHAAEIYVRLGATERANAILTALISKNDLAASWRARARRLRADIARDAGKAAERSVDLTWLALEAPLESASMGADLELEAVRGAPLTKAERFRRTEAFASGGRVSATEDEAVRLKSAPGSEIAETDLLRARAWAHFKSRSYSTAADLFARSAQGSLRYRTQDSFYAARSLSRANKDDVAIQRYLDLIQKNQSSAFAEEAQYLVARLQLLLGQWQRATESAQTYLTRFARDGRFVDAARHVFVIGSFALHRPEDAERSLRRLLAGEDKPREHARLTELLGVALAEQGRTSEAIEQFKSTIGAQPLSFAALAASARLAALDAPAAPAIASDGEATQAFAPLALQLPQKVNFLFELGLDADVEREIEDQTQALERAHSPRGSEALCQAYAALAPARARYRYAQRVVRERVLQHAIEPGTRWLWECIYPSPYIEAATGAAGAGQVPLDLIYSVVRQESAFDPSAGSAVGARGLMQLMPETATHLAKDLGLEFQVADLANPRVNLRLGASYLGMLLRRFVNPALAAAAYNAGPAALNRWLDVGHGLPLDLFVAFIPYAETREYVERVMGNWARYSYLRGGSDALPALALELPQHRDDDPEQY
ncbi:MAG TPA: transglycosylase SLT domain-containing protein [Polyangiaceae bacterium]|nr:transglycosylase SLT domain-containing protein [Polyangiaceae bacterium]